MDFHIGIYMDNYNLIHGLNHNFNYIIYNIFNIKNKMTYYQANTKLSNRYDLSPNNIDSSISWQRNHMYCSSTLNMSNKNVK